MSSSHMDYQLIDDKAGKAIVGHFPRAMLETPQYPWFLEGYHKKAVAPQDVNLVRAISDQIEVLIFMGTWCGDSRHHVPEFLKILDEAQIPKDRVVMIGLDRTKHLGTITDQFKITRIPTFIFLTGGRELGRITEHPKKSLLEDTNEILEAALKK